MQVAGVSENYHHEELSDKEKGGNAVLWIDSLLGEVEGHPLYSEGYDETGDPKSYLFTLFTREWLADAMGLFATAHLWKLQEDCHGKHDAIGRVLVDIPGFYFQPGVAKYIKEVYDDRQD